MHSNIVIHIIYSTSALKIKLFQIFWIEFDMALEKLTFLKPLNIFTSMHKLLTK